MSTAASQITSLTILLKRLFRGISEKASKLRVTGLCAGNSPVTGEFPAQRASNAEDVSIWWRHLGRKRLSGTILLKLLVSTSWRQTGAFEIIQSEYARDYLTNGGVRRVQMFGTPHILIKHISIKCYDRNEDVYRGLGGISQGPLLLHDNVIKWKHFPHYWPFVRGIHRSPVNSPHKGQWRGALMLSLICVWRNSWVNNLEAGDLRRYRTHYDVIVMNLGEL